MQYFRSSSKALSLDRFDTEKFLVCKCLKGKCIANKSLHSYSTWKEEKYTTKLFFLITLEFFPSIFILFLINFNERERWNWKESHRRIAVQQYCSTKVPSSQTCPCGNIQTVFKLKKCLKISTVATSMAIEWRRKKIEICWWKSILTTIQKKERKGAAMTIWKWWFVIWSLHYIQLLCVYWNDVWRLSEVIFMKDRARIKSWAQSLKYFYYSV